MTPRNTAFLFIAYALSFFPCAAQEAGQVTLQFLSFPKSIAPEPVELVVGENSHIEVAIPSNDLSQPYTVKRMGTWAVGKTVPGADGKKSFEVYGQAPALPDAKQLILLVRKGKVNADGMDMIPIPNGIANFGGGVFFFLNTAVVDVAGEIGGEKFVIQPGKHAIVRPKPDAAKQQEGRNQVHTKLYFRKGDEARPFFSSTWPLNDKARSLVIFYHDPHTKNIRLHTVRDFLP